MKTITCLDCDQQFSGETPDAVMEEMMVHYFSEHHEALEDSDVEEPRDGWFIEFNKRWDAAPNE